MLDPRSQELVTLTFPRYQWKVIAWACRQGIRLKRRELTNSADFIPEPGKTNVHVAYIEALEKANYEIAKGSM